MLHNLIYAFFQDQLDKLGKLATFAYKKRFSEYPNCCDYQWNIYFLAQASQCLSYKWTILVQAVTWQTYSFVFLSTLYAISLVAANWLDNFGSG